MTVQAILEADRMVVQASISFSACSAVPGRRVATTAIRSIAPPFGQVLSLQGRRSGRSEHRRAHLSARGNYGSARYQASAAALAEELLTAASVRRVSSSRRAAPATVRRSQTKSQCIETHSPGAGGDEPEPPRRASARRAAPSGPSSSVRPSQSSGRASNVGVVALTARTSAGVVRHGRGRRAARRRCPSAAARARDRQRRHGRSGAATAPAATASRHASPAAADAAAGSGPRRAARARPA